ncbi:succinate dehydrogenase, partial [Streptomyces purpurascens]
MLYLVVHMIGNLKIFFGAGEFNDDPQPVRV